MELVQDIELLRKRNHGGKIILKHRTAVLPVLTEWEEEMRAERETAAGCNYAWGQLIKHIRPVLPLRNNLR